MNKTILTMVLIIFSMPLIAKEPPKMKMTTEVPEGIATPDSLETHIGTLKSFDGVPDAKRHN